MQIFVLCPVRYAATIAFVMESLIGLAERGHQVDVLVSDNADPPFHCDHPDVRVFEYSDTGPSSGLWYAAFMASACARARIQRYDLTIGLSQMGLIGAAHIKRRFGVPCVWFNDEIWSGNERHTLLGNAFGRLLKCLERRAGREVLFAVTQDVERARWVADVNRMESHVFRYLPNSRSGAARLSQSKYLHERFGFPEDATIVLWMGGVSPNDGALELAREAQNWPTSYRMVFHFRNVRPSAYGRAIIACHGTGATYVSREPIPYREVEDLVASATIGLGLYADKGVNSRYIGASSGKINAFLKAGVPCIVSDYEGLRWVQESGAGVCVKNASTILEAAGRIMQDIGTYRSRAVTTFDSHLRFDTAFAGIVEEIEDYIGQQYAKVPSRGRP